MSQEDEGAVTAPPSAEEEATTTVPHEDDTAAATATISTFMKSPAPATEPDMPATTPSVDGGPLEEKKEADVSPPAAPAPETPAKESDEVEKTDVVEPAPPASDVVPEPPTDSATAAATTSSATTTPTASPARRTGTGEPTGKGAQILMNRFQTLKERANQNAQTLWSKGTPVLTTKVQEMRSTNLWKAAPSIGIGTTFRQSFQQTKPDEQQVSGETAESQARDQVDDANRNESSVDESSSSTAAASNKAEEIRPKQFSLIEANVSEKEAAEGGMGGDDKIIIEDGAEEDFDDRDSSIGGASDAAATKLLVGRAFTKASLAATVAYESVLSSGFRGRYNASSSGSNVGGSNDGSVGEKTDEGTLADTRPAKESQTELILKSRVGQHMQAILDKLEPYEYAMLLGRGMLGVNLKQCYLKNHGVFIDFLVPGGQAESSGVIRSGDLAVRLGDVDLRKGTILDIPTEISKARRPVVLTMATGTKVSLERMNYIDVAVAMMHRARAYYTKRGTLSNLPSASSPKKKQAADEQQTSSPATMEIQSVSEVTVPPAETIDSFLTPPAPTLDIRREFLEEVPLRYVQIVHCLLSPHIQRDEYVSSHLFATEQVLG